MKERKESAITRRFGSRKVFAVYLACSIITIITMILSIIFSLTVRQPTAEKTIEHITLCVVAIVLLNVPVIMQSKFSFRIPSFLQIAVEIFIVAHFVLGEIFRFYDNVFLYDKILHITAGVIIAILGFSIVYGFSQTDSTAVKLSPFFVAMFSFCFSLALLTLWEVFEYIMDSAFAMNMQRWEDGLSEVVIDGVAKQVTDPARGSGLIDTMSDMIVGLIGALVVSIAGGIWAAKNPNNTRFFITKSKKAKQKGEDARVHEQDTIEGGAGEVQTAENGNAEVQTQEPPPDNINDLTEGT